MSKVMHLTYASSLSRLREINSSFDAGILRIAYHGENRNRSYISKEDFERNIHSALYCPVVCRYDREENNLGGHDMEIVRDGNGRLSVVNVTTPVGVVPDPVDYWWEEITEEDGTVHEYLCLNTLLWKRQEAYQYIKEHGVVSESMEITVSRSENINGILHIHDFEFTAFTLIGVEPCFESASLEVFSAEFKQQLSEMMQDLKDTYILVDDQHSGVDETNAKDAGSDNIITTYEEGGSDTLDDFQEVINQNTEVESTRPDDAQQFDASENDVPDTEPISEEEVAFALTSEIVEEIIHVISEEQVEFDWGDMPRYHYVDCDVDAMEVYVYDAMDDWLLYGFKFSMDGDAVVIDYDSKRRKKYVIVDFVEGDTQRSPFASAFARIGTIATDLKNTADQMSTELDALRAFKHETEDAVRMQELNEIYARFAMLNGIEAYDDMAARIGEYDAQSLEEACYAICGRNGVNALFSNNNDGPKVAVTKTLPDMSDEPYGGLFIKYGFHK